MRVVSARNERRRYGVAACALREDHALRNDFSLALCDPNVRFGSKADMTLRGVRSMSALAPKADMDQSGCDVRFVPKADIAPRWLLCLSSGAIRCSWIRERPSCRAALCRDEAKPA
jgi:hypothetical protein